MISLGQPLGSAGKHGRILAQAYYELMGVPLLLKSLDFGSVL